MAFNIALSGIRAASLDLEVTGNNIANASTTGFKESRTEFADVYANSLYGDGALDVGDGVRVARAAQNFSQGNLAYTENELDIAIDGQGFFILHSGNGISYTRDGTFGLDNDGYVVNNNGARLQGYPSDGAGGVSGVTDDLQVNTQNIQPKQTSNVEWTLNLNAGTEAMDPTIAFNPDDPLSYHDAAPVTVHDAQGNEHVLTQFYVKTDDNTWMVHSQINDEIVDSTEMRFNPDGQLEGTGLPITIDDWAPDESNDDENSTLTIRYPNTTQYFSQFGASNVTQNGFNTGRLSGLEIGRDGTINARFTNGQSQVLGQMALAEFNNDQGLDPIGGNAWAETHQSGEPTVGKPGTASRGLLNSGALEESNVDLTEQLVQLILAQRNFQANSKTIETADQVTQTMINLR